RGHFQVGVYQILLDVLSIVMIYEICKRLIRKGEFVGLLAGIFYALYPYLIFQNLTVIDTPLYMTLSFAFLLLMVLLRDRPAWDRQATVLIVLSGIVLGLIYLTRPAFVVLLPFAAIWFLFRMKFWQTAARFAVMGLISLFVLIPWTVHNYMAFHAFIPIAS